MTDPFERFKAMICLYQSRVSGYADHFLLDQVNAMPDSELLLRHPPPPSLVPDTQLRVAQMGRVAVAVDSTLGRAFNVLSGGRGQLRPVEGVRLRRRLRDYPVIYTLFASEAIPIVRWLPSTCRLIVHCAGTDITTAAARPAAYQKALRDVLQTAYHVNCGSEFLVRTALALGAPPEKTSVHYLGVDVPASLASHVREGGAPTILAVSRLHPVKGLSYTIEAFALVARSTPDVTLEIIGGGPELAQLKSRAEDLGVAGRVNFRGELPRVQVFEAMARADVFVQHNVRLANGAEEALGGSLLEASARGLPVVATSSGGVPEAVVHGITGLLSPPMDTRAMAENLQALLDSSSLRHRLGSAGREFVASHHNSDHQTKLLAQQLRSAASFTV